MRKTVRSLLISPLTQVCFLAALPLTFHWIPMSLRWPVRLLAAVLVVWLVLSLALSIVRIARSKPIQLVFAGVLAMLLYAALELCFFFVERLVIAKDATFLSANALSLSEMNHNSIRAFIDDEVPFYRFDADTGWSLRPNSDFHDFYHSNAQGFRGPANHRYTEHAPPEKTRAIALGDSFTFGSEVRDAHAWPARAQEADPDLELINGGVPGYGLTQSFVRYQKLKSQFQTDYVIVGYMTENIRRTLNVYRPFIKGGVTGFPFAKPFSRLDDSGELEIVPPLLPDKESYERLLENSRTILSDMAAKDYYYSLDRLSSAVLPSVRVLRYLWNQERIKENILDLFSVNKTLREMWIDHSYTKDSYPLRTVCELLTRFVEEVKMSGAKPLIGIFPTRRDIARFNEEGIDPCQTLRDYLDANGYDYIAVLDVINEHYKGREIPLKEVYLKFHFDEEINDLIGRNIAEWIAADRAAEKRGDASAEVRKRGLE